jgi:glucose uptake protein GlcU
MVFSPQSHAVATMFLFGVMGCWGSWPNLRKLSKTEAPVFVILYVCSQWLTMFLFAMSLGNIAQESGNIFDNESFLHELRNRTGSFDKILLVLVSGFLNANGDFLCATALVKLPSSVANPIYGGWVLIQGTLLNFFVEKYDGNMYLLFLGVFTAFCGIVCMTASDYYAADLSTRMHSKIVSVDSAACEELGDTLYQTLTAESPLLTSEHRTELVSAKVVKKWIFVCILAGVVCGAWAPLTVIATEGPGSIQCPYVMMFFFQTGQVTAIPFMIFYYYKLLAPAHDALAHKLGREPSPSIGNLWTRLVDSPLQDKFYGCLTGIVVGTGFFFYFTAVDVIPSTISFAISNCSPLVTIFNDVVFCDHLRHATTPQKRYMLLATILFAAAISFMVLAESS